MIEIQRMRMRRSYVLPSHPAHSLVFPLLRLLLLKSRSHLDLLRLH